MIKAAPNAQRNPFGIVPRDLFDLRLPDGSRLDAVDVGVFTALATFADADRYAWPAIDTLADMVNRSRRCTIDHLRRLEDAGAITSDARYDAHGRQTSNGYVLDLLKSAPRGAPHCMGTISTTKQTSMKSSGESFQPMVSLIALSLANIKTAAK